MLAGTTDVIFALSHRLLARCCRLSIHSISDCVSMCDGYFPFLGVYLMAASPENREFPIAEMEIRSTFVSRLAKLFLELGDKEYERWNRLVEKGGSEPEAQASLRSSTI